MHEGELIVVLMTLIVLAGAALMVAAMMTRRRMRELTHRERMAMIERGLIPSPESDPAGFEKASGIRGRRESSAAVRFRTAGIILIGLGFGLMVLITFTVGSAAVGFGVGGAWAALGGALLLNYFLMTRREEDGELGPPTRWVPPPPQHPREPPSNLTP